MKNSTQAANQTRSKGVTKIKPLRKVDQPPKPVEPVKKPDLIPLKKDGPPTKPADVKTSQPSITIPITPTPRTPEPPSANDKQTPTPKSPQPKLTFPSPKTPEAPKTPSAAKTPDPFKPPPRTPESPKTPDPPKTYQPLNPPSRTPDTPKSADFRFAPEPPKNPDPPKTPEGLPKIIPSRSPDSGMPDIPLSGKNPAYVPPPNQTEFPLPPYLPGTPQTKPASRDDELFAMGNAFATPAPNRPVTDFRDLSYAKGEFPGEETLVKVKETVKRIPKYMEQSVISNPDSLESDEEDEDF